MGALDRIIVVGAGPVGLVAALRLARAGIPVLVLERGEDIAEELRASTFHPPTLDMLDELGLAQPLIAQGLVTPTWQIRLHETGERAEFDLSVLADETRHPYRLQCEQHRLSRLLLGELRKISSAEIAFGAEVTGLTQDGDAVTVTACVNGEERHHRAAYVIGTDGARSAVRTAIGLELQGETYPETTILVTTTFPFHEHLEGLSNVNYVWHGAGTFSLLRLPDLWRASLYPREGESLEEAVTDESIEAKLQEIVPRPERYEVVHKRTYRVHQRIVGAYRVGRVALAGDAAHLNSPSGGMGMNGGIHDAFNLTSKLIAISRREADEGILDAYDRQRRPIARDEIIAQADRNRARMRERDPGRRRALLRQLQDLAADAVEARAYLLRTSMIDGLRRAEQVQ